jgi:hypothetical protein
MRPTRKDLLKQIAELIWITQDLVRATEESTRASRQLQADVARLVRRARVQRSKKLDRRSRAVATGGRDPLPLMRMTLLKGGVGVAAAGGSALEASVAVAPAPPST